MSNIYNSTWFWFHLDRGFYVLLGSDLLGTGVC